MVGAKKLYFQIQEIVFFESLGFKKFKFCDFYLGENGIFELFNLGLTKARIVKIQAFVSPNWLWYLFFILTHI